MPSLADSAVIFILALMLFGPKKLPQLARQLGKLMAEFRRASNEFRMQMEDELRMEEQKEHQAKVAAMDGPPSTLPDPEHPHMPAPIAESGDLRMMPPSTGLPTESATYGTSTTYGAEPPPAEHTIMPPDHDGPVNPIHYGTTSEEPAQSTGGEPATHA